MSLRKQATTGLLWTFSQQFGNQIIAFVVSLILARILLPAEFGLIGMIAILVGLGRVLVDSGLTQSLIRNQEVGERDYSTVFYFNFFTSLIIYGLAFLSAPFVANFYDQAILVPIIRLYSLVFIIDSFSSVQLARLTKTMNFKLQTLISLPATLIGGGVGIYMAYSDFGVYSLVWSQITISLISSIQIWIYSGWRPKIIFDYSLFKDHFNFGYKLAISGVLEVVFKNAYLLVIGRFFSPAQVGFYTRAETMKHLPVNNISTALKKVTYPLFASIQDDNLRLKRVYKQLMQMVVFILAPVLIFLAVLAEPTFRLLFTEKWLPAVPYFQILCIVGILKPIHSYNLNVLMVKGRSDLLLKIKLLEKIIIVAGILIALQFGIYGLLYAQVVISFIMFFINAYNTNKFIDYPAIEQMKSLLPTLILALISGFIIYIFDKYYFYSQLDFLRIMVGGLLGVLIYTGSSMLFKMESYLHFKKIILKR